jgi:dihydrofolate reductase
MDTVTLFSSVSVDGYATGPGGDLSRLHRWLFDFDSGRPTAYDDEFFRAFRDAGAIVFGRRTYDSGQEPWGDDDVFEAPVFVLTHERLGPVAKNGTVFTFVDGSPGQVLGLAREAAGERGVVIMGSPDVAQQFLRDGLVDVLLLHVVPVLLGGGTPLFGALADSLELRQTLAMPGEEVALARYEVVRQPEASAARNASPRGAAREPVVS